MAIITFVSNCKEETGKTLSMASIATSMAIEHNYKILLVVTDYNDTTLEECFIDTKKKKSILGGIVSDKINIVGLDSGMEGLSKIIKSNKTTPDQISNYTTIIFNENRLEILPAYKGSESLYGTIKESYPEIIALANHYYDMVFVDLGKKISKEIENKILKMSNVVVNNITQRMKNLDSMINLKKNGSLYAGENAIFLIGKYDLNSKYTLKNVGRYIGEKKDIGAIPYNTLLFEASSEGKVADLFINIRNINENDKNAPFLTGVRNARERIIQKISEVQRKM